MAKEHPALDPALLSCLAAEAESADWQTAWPAASMGLLKALRAHEWSLPSEWGGRGWRAGSLQAANLQLGQACLTTAFLFSQREAAVRRLLTSTDRPIAQELLPRLARGEIWSTVGVAQLTSSRQHLGPALRATRAGDELILEGYAPWVSGAAAAEYLIVGAILDESPILVVVPRDQTGLRVGPPMELLALRGSQTAELHFAGARVARHYLLEDRPERVNAGDGAGGLTTSCLALAVASSALQYLEDEAKARPDLGPVFEPLRTHWRELWAELTELAQGPTPDPSRFPSLRAAATQLALRSTQAALTASKGLGFVHPHPAQRWARQALFFLVWSCPRPTAEAVLASLCDL